MFWPHQYWEINMRPYSYSRVVNLTILQLCNNSCLIFQAWVVSCLQFLRWVCEILNLQHISGIHALVSLDIMPTKSPPKHLGEDFYKIIAVVADIWWCPTIETLEKKATTAPQMWIPRSSTSRNCSLHVWNHASLCCGFWSCLVNLAHLLLLVYIPHICDASILTPIT